MKLRTLDFPCRNWQALWAALAVCTALAFPMASLAGPGHDHGDDHGNSNPSNTGVSSPRFVMSSELFDAVGIVKGKAIELYVDHANTNAPVENASLELELNGQKVPVTLHAVGEFDAVLPEEIAKNAAESPISVALTVTAGEQLDLLAGELVIGNGDKHRHEEEAHSHRLDIAMFVLLGLLLLALAVFVAQWTKKRKQVQGGKP